MSDPRFKELLQKYHGDRFILQGATASLLRIAERVGTYPLAKELTDKLAFNIKEDYYAAKRRLQSQLKAQPK